MSTRKNSKNIILVILLLVVVGMAVGYAALSQALVINGTANVSAEWKIIFTDIKEGNELLVFCNSCGRIYHLKFENNEFLILNKIQEDKAEA